MRSYHLDHWPRRKSRRPHLLIGVGEREECMDYQLENLGDERFQELCQALLVREFPDVQCFPVGMPDGGRDAVRWFYVTKGEKSFSVFQVKYVRKPLAEEDPHKWLEKTLEGEVEKYP